MKNIIIEVVQQRDSCVCHDRIQKECEMYFKETGITPGRTLSNIKSNEFLLKNVYCIIIDESSETTANIYCEYAEWNISWYIYRLDTIGAQEEVIDDVGDETMTWSRSWLLPSEDFHGLWENLVYENSIKQNLLCYVETTLLFSTKLVDQNIISSNRMVLLHGPPGTGKTSLCKALAHKLAIRLIKYYDSAQLMEVNSHSLMSKWFSESGKLVTKMFSYIETLANESPRSLIVILIDEVESLAHARLQAMSGSEPSDSLRVVNAVLTQLDHLRHYPNVLILTTSNLTGAIDLAFVDRADIKQYIGLPSVGAIYQVYYSCIQELLRAEIIKPHHVIFPLNYFKGDIHHSESLELLKISQLSIGFSGRTLRKMPFLAHALFLRNESATLLEFLQALSLAVEKYRADNKQF